MRADKGCGFRVKVSHGEKVDTLHNVHKIELAGGGRLWFSSEIHGQGIAYDEAVQFEAVPEDAICLRFEGDMPSRAREVMRP
ncbi:MAG: hypothetical protein WC822_06515 [Candidatus Paceibacterota bacterium]|jgi:hypothetical protein